MIFLILFSTGCATTWESPGAVYQQEQFDLLTKEVEFRKLDYNKRLGEIEQAYADGKLNEGEYLTLKNDLKQEWHAYCTSTDQRASSITQNALQLNH